MTWPPTWDRAHFKHSEPDASSTRKQRKLDVRIPAYVILGACNPPLAHRALTAEPDIGLLLPCNLVVYVEPDGGTIVAALDPVAQLRLSANPSLEPLAREVRARLQRVVAAVAALNLS